MFLNGSAHSAPTPQKLSSVDIFIRKSHMQLTILYDPTAILSLKIGVCSLKTQLQCYKTHYKIGPIFDRFLFSKNFPFRFTAFFDKL